MEPTVPGTAGLTAPDTPVQPTLQMWIAPDDKLYFDDVIKMHKCQAKKDSETIKYYVNLFKNGEFKEGSGASANFTFSDVSLLMAVLLARDPTIVVNPQHAGDLPSFDVLIQLGIAMDPVDAATKYAQLIEDTETFIWTDTCTSDTVSAALFNAICTGIGYAKISFDPDRNTSRVDALNRDEVFVDPLARYSIRQASYVSICCTKEVKEAQRFFDSIGAGYQVQGNFKLSEAEGLIGDMAKKSEPDGQEKNKRYFRFFEIWCKKPDGQRIVYYRNYDKDEDWFYSRAWPYILDNEEFPIVELVFNRQFQSAQDPFTDLSVINGLRKGYENVVEFYRSHVMRGVASKIIYNKAAFGMKDLEAMLDSDDFKAIPAELAPDMSLDNVFKVINFTEDAGVVIELANSLKTIKDEIFGISEMQRSGGGKKYTAKQAEITNDWTSARVDRRQALLDEFMERIVCIRTKIDLLLTPSDKVARIAGPQAQMMWDLFDGDLDELKCLYSIKIAAGSSGQAAKDKKIEMMERCYKLMQAENGMQPMPLYNTAKIVEELLKLYDLPHPERFIMAPAPMPQGMLPAMEQPAGAPPVDGNDPNAQGAMGAGPGGAQPPLPTMPGESELGSALPA